MLNHAKLYISLLNKYPNFSQLNNNNELFFKYSDDNDINLITLRKTYGIDTIIAGLDTMDKIISLTEWVHNELFCVGSNINPPHRDSLSILSVKGQGALFCYYQAIVLNDALLSIGIKSRIIKCLPYEFDMDCHVGVIAFISERNKWVFFDPTFNTYFTDNNGNPLSLIEIRNEFKQGRIPVFKHITIKKDWVLIMNGIICDTYDDWYSIYMAKNCFRFASPLESLYNYASKDTGSTIFLNPIAYDIKNEYDNNIKNSHLSLYTNNINCFFRSPN